MDSGGTGGARGLQQFAGVAEGGGGVGVAGEHAGDLGDAVLAGEFFHLGAGAALVLGFFHAQVVGGEAGDLGEVGDAQHLVVFAQALQFAAHGGGRLATDAGVYFIQHERPARRRPGGPLGVGFGGEMEGEEEA